MGAVRLGKALFRPNLAPWSEPKKGFGLGYEAEDGGAEGAPRGSGKLGMGEELKFAVHPLYSQALYGAFLSLFPSSQ